MGKPKHYYELLDGLRAYAVLAVLVSHWIFMPAIQKLGLGFFGVNLFFVISGFLITEILFKDISDGRTVKSILKKFYWRRTLRIFPIYYLACFGLYILNFSDAREVITYNVLYITNFYNYFTGDLTQGFSHIWSLCVEEQFYLVWPAVLLSLRKNSKLGILFVISAAVLIRLGFWYFQPDYYSVFNYRMTPACMDGFGFGALLAYIKTNNIDTLKRVLKKVWIPALCFVVYVANAFVFKNEFINEVLNRFLICVVSFFLIGWAIGEYKYIGAFLKNKYLKYIGRVSYGVYLYHLFISKYLDTHLDTLIDTLKLNSISVIKYNPYLIKFPIYTLLTILLASISYSLIETRFLKLKNKFS